MLTNTTSRPLLSRGAMFAPGDAIDVNPATLPEWDAVRRAFDRGELRAAVVSVPQAASVTPEPPAEPYEAPTVEAMPTSKPALWRLVKALGLDEGIAYRTTTVQELRELLERGADG